MKVKFVYEAMGDVLKSKSEEEIMSSLENTNLKPDELLIKSTNVGFLAGVKKAIEMGANVHVDNDYALRLTSERGYLPIVKLLLDAGANIHQYEDYALCVSSQGGYKDVVELLLKNGADVHVVNDEALREASLYGHKDIVELLLKNGANIHANEDKALEWASLNGHCDVVELLLKNGANVHDNIDKLLRYALRRGHHDVVKLLNKYMNIKESLSNVLKGKSEEEILSSIEKGNLNSDNLLIKSTNVGFLPGVKKALEIGADVHVADDYALEWASRYGYKEIVELLLKHGANVHAKDDLAFRWASQNGYLATAKLLLKYMNIKESLVNIFKPKSQEEINRDLIELYGFIPSDEETLILAIDRGKMKPGDHPYPIEYHRDSIGVFWKKLPGQRPLSRLKSSEILWLLDIIDGKHEFDSQWIKGPKFK